MNKSSKIVLVIVALAVVIAGVAIYLRGNVFGGITHYQKESFSVGLFAGGNRQFEINKDGQTFAGGFTQSAGNTALVDANGGTYTLTQAELLNSSMLTFTAGGAGQEVIALTFPATSTMTTLIPSAGDCRSWWYDSSALAAATTTTLTAGTGHNVIAYTTDDDVIDGNEFSQITMCRRSNTDVNTFVTEMLHAD